MRKTTALQVHYAFQYISLTSTARLRREPPNATFHGGRGHTSTNFPFVQCFHCRGRRRCLRSPFFFFSSFFQYNFIEHTHVQLTFTKDNPQQNENYSLKLTKKKPNTTKH